MDRIRGYLQTADMLNYIGEVKESNQAFREYIASLGEARDDFNTVRNMAATQNMVTVLRRYHVDTDYIVNLIQTLFGWL